MSDERIERRGDEDQPVYDRRHTDKGVEEVKKLILDHIKTQDARWIDLAVDLKPMKDFMTSINAIKTVILWGVGILAVLGGLITWLFNCWDHVKGHGG